jgi:hypothetical protein
MATDDDALFDRSGDLLTADELRALDLKISKNRRRRHVYLKAIAESSADIYAATKLNDAPPEEL